MCLLLHIQFLIYTLIATTINANIINDIFRWLDLTSLYFGGSKETDTSGVYYKKLECLISFISFKANKFFPLTHLRLILFLYVDRD